MKLHYVPKRGDRFTSCGLMLPITNEEAKRMNVCWGDSEPTCRKCLNKKQTKVSVPKIKSADPYEEGMRIERERIANQIEANIEVFEDDDPPSTSQILKGWVEDLREGKSLRYPL